LDYILCVCVCVCVCFGAQHYYGVLCGVLWYICLSMWDDRLWACVDCIVWAKSAIRIRVCIGLEDVFSSDCPCIGRINELTP
jgi:hypothetical protein